MAASSDFGRLGRPLFNSAREQVPRSLQLSPSMRHVSLSREDLVDALERTARGDRAAFEKVYAATAVKLYGIVIRILGRRDLAEDILQEVYIRVWQRASEFDPATGS